MTTEQPTVQQCVAMVPGNASIPDTYTLQEVHHAARIAAKPWIELAQLLASGQYTVDDKGGIHGQGAQYYSPAFLAAHEITMLQRLTP